MLPAEKYLTARPGAAKDETAIRPVTFFPD